MAFFNRKKKEQKKKEENIIGKIIYGFLLFSPLLSILFTSLYTTFNKNAYESYYGETINETIYHNCSASEFQQNIQYTWTKNRYESEESGSDSEWYYIENFYYGDTLRTENRFRLYRSSSGVTRLLFYDTNDQYLEISDTDTLVVKFTFLYTSGASNKQYKYLAIFMYETHNKYSYLDNSFEYGIYKTEQSNIYNWSKSTGTYTVLQNVCNNIGITNTFTPMLMAYWLLISVIYFLFDIALILIWAVHDKIHELKDAI